MKLDEHHIIISKHKKTQNGNNKHYSQWYESVSFIKIHNSMTVDTFK